MQYSKNFFYDYCKPVAVLSILMLICAVQYPAAASEHLTPLPLLHFKEQTVYSDTARMSEDDFAALKASLDKECEHRYASLLQNSNMKNQEYLRRSQAAWRSFAASLENTLRQQLDVPVKVFFGSKTKERITNIYMDLTRDIYLQRISDLTRWSSNNFVPLSLPKTEKKSLYDEELQKVNKMAANTIYIMEEKYRRAEFESQKSWREYLKSNADYITLITGSQDQSLEEQILLMRRINNMRALQSEGLVFFRTEREE